MKELTFHSLKLQAGLLLVLAVLVLLLPQRSEGKDGGSPMLRIVCATVLEGHEEYVLASRDDDGSLDELHKMKLRNSFVSPWISVPSGVLDLCVSEDEELVSTCSFTFPNGASRLLLVLLPGEKDGKYSVEVIDAKKEKFDKGKILLINASDHAGVVMLGESRVDAEVGKSQVIVPPADENGMYRLVVSYLNEKEEVICKDSFVPVNGTGREYLIMLSDLRATVNVVSLIEFGPFE